MKFKKRINALFWWVLQIAPVLFVLALHFVDFGALPELVGDGGNFGFFGDLFVQFSGFFADQLALYQLLIISFIDWSLTLSLLRVVYELLYIFTSWLYHMMDWRKKDA